MTRETVAKGADGLSMDNFPGKRTILVAKSDLEVFGSRSLVGRLYAEGIIEICDLEILFEQSSDQWKKEHGGPDEIIVPEHLALCLVEDILKLQEMGFKVSVGTYESKND